MNVASRPCCEGQREGSPPVTSSQPYRILRLVVSVTECNSAYNQFTLPHLGRYATTICTYYKTAIPIADGVTVMDGDGTVRGFVRNLRKAFSYDNYDIVHAHSPHLACLFLLANGFRRQRMARTVLTAHNSYQNFKRRNRVLLMPAFLGFRRVVCCGSAAMESFPWLYRRLAGRRARAVTNGVNLQRIDDAIAGIAECEPSARFTVACVGRLIDIKNPFTVVRAFEQGAGGAAHLTFIGDGYLRHAVQALIGQAGMANRCCITGVIARDDVFHRLCQADLFVSASRGEGLPVAVLEAMACGCPVVLSDIPPHREIASENACIPLVSPDDVAGFAREIGKFREMPPEERKAIGRKCRELVERQFSLEAMRAGYERVYSEVAKSSVAQKIRMP